MKLRSILVACSSALAACDPAAAEPPQPVPGEPPVRAACVEDRGDAFVDCIDTFEPSAPASFGHDAMPAIVLGPPRADGDGGGGMDVASLGCGGRITLGFAGDAIVDHGGDDFIVFENAFATAQGSFAEPAAVLVSDDGERWYAFECGASPGDDADGCAGVTPTEARSAAAAVDPTRAGGDAFDLAALGLARARYVRLVDRTREYYGDDSWCGGSAAGFDLDAVAVVPR